MAETTPYRKDGQSPKAGRTSPDGDGLLADSSEKKKAKSFVKILRFLLGREKGYLGYGRDLNIKINEIERREMGRKRRSD